MAKGREGARGENRGSGTPPPPKGWSRRGEGGGGLKGGVRGVWLGTPSSQGPAMVPAEGGRKIYA